MDTVHKPVPIFSELLLICFDLGPVSRSAASEHFRDACGQNIAS
jgi:hypothetical protein